MNDVSQNGQRLTPQQAMDKEFADKGIPSNCGHSLWAMGRPPDSLGSLRP